MHTFTKLSAYMGKRKLLFPWALILSGAGSALGMVPYIFIWLIIKELFRSQVEQSQALINSYAWLAMGTAVGGIIIYFLALTLSHLAAFRVETNMRRRAMERLVKAPLGFFERNTSGRIRKIIDDNAGITHSFLAHQMPDLAGTIVMPIVSLVLIFVFDWKFGLASLVPVILSMMIMGFMMGKRGKDFMKSYLNSLESMNSEAVEYVRGIPVVKVFQQTVFSFKNFHNSIKMYRDMVIRYTRMWRKPMSTYTVIIHGFAYFLIPLAVIIIANGGNTAEVIINLIFYLLISPLFAQAIMRSMYLNQALGQAAEAVNRTEDLTNVEPLPVADRPKTVESREIVFRDVSFSYPGSGQKAIEGITFTIPEGERVALVGASGSGKTTIARMVPRFWDVDSGEVTIGGVNIKEIAKAELMGNVSFVFQNTRLFKTTLLENICYGTSGASKEDIKKAITMAQCREFIGRLPEGLNTMIGSEGTYLSGGEQQRIALARAFLKDAPIIVMDEATAFADPENEHLIQRALRKLTRGKTVLMIAHRLTSVMDADRILVIDGGRIAEEGTHIELLKRDGLYTRMWNEYQKAVHWTLAKEINYV